MDDELDREDNPYNDIRESEPTWKKWLRKQSKSDKDWHNFFEVNEKKC